jgi:hypothetical protein
VDRLTESLTPEQMDEWMAWNLKHNGTVNGERLLHTLAAAASAVCGSNGLELEPWRVIPGAEGHSCQTEEEQMAIMAAFAARQNAGC